MSTQRTVTGPAVIKLGISNLVWPRPWRSKLCLLERQRAGREGGGRSGAAPAPPRRLPSSRCNKAALSGPPSVCRRVRDPCVLRFSALLEGWPDRAGPRTPCSGLALLLERAWVKTGHKPGASSRSEGPCAPCAHCSRNRALARRQLASSAPDKNQLQQIARSAARCSRARVGARAPRLRGGDSCDSAPRRAALLGTFVHTQRTSRARASAVL